MVKMNINLKRIVALLADLVILTFVVANVFNILGIFLKVENGIFLILFISKDVLLKGESLGKRICKLELLTITNEKPTFLVKILRNLTILIWPIELVLVIVLNKRLGDIIFKTKVVEKR